MGRWTIHKRRTSCHCCEVLFLLSNVECFDSLLKIWNMNDSTGVVGVFNCQGAGWCEVGKKNLIHDERPGTINGVIRAKDVDYLPKLADDNWTGDAIVYSHRYGELTYLHKDASLPVTLQTREYDVFTVVPAKTLSSGVNFAPIGLHKMFNSGGAIKDVKYEAQMSGYISMKVRGCGLFGVYSSVRPKRVTVDGKKTNFEHEEGSGLLTLGIRVPEQELYLWDVMVEI